VIVRWSRLAIDRVVEIGEWIASERPAAAIRIVDGLFDAAERLEAFPLRGRRVPEFDERTDLREIFYEQFRIVYKVSGVHVDILTVRHMLQLMDPGDFGQ
jgi:plasmid stabilization system protein ParE